MGTAVADNLRWLERKKLESIYPYNARILFGTEIFYKLEKLPNPSFIKTFYSKYVIQKELYWFKDKEKIKSHH